MKTGKNTTIATTSRRGMLLVDSNMLLRIGASAMIGSAFSTAATGTDTSPSSPNRLATIAASTPTTRAADQADQRVRAAGQAGLPDVTSLVDQNCSPIADGAGRMNGAIRPDA